MRRQLLVVVLAAVSAASIWDACATKVPTPVPAKAPAQVAVKPKLAAAAIAGSAVVRIAATPSVAVGGQVAVALTVDLSGVTSGSAPAALGGYQVQVSFPAALLRLDAVLGGATSGFTGVPVFTGLSAANSAGSVTVVASQATNPTGPTGAVNVATLAFTALAPGTATLTGSALSLATTYQPGPPPSGPDAVSAAAGSATVSVAGPTPTASRTATAALPSATRTATRSPSPVAATATATPTRSPVPSATPAVAPWTAVFPASVANYAPPVANVGGIATAVAANTGSVAWAFYAPAASTVTVWCRVLAPNGEDDSWFVSVDGGAEDIYDVAEGLWSPNWQWTRVNGRGGTATPLKINPRTFAVAAGSHVITFRAREIGAQISDVAVTNDPSFVPSVAPSPTVTPSATVSPVPSPSLSQTPTPSATPSSVPPTFTATSSPTATPSSTATPVPPTATPTPTRTPTPTVTPNLEQRVCDLERAVGVGPCKQ